MPSQKSAVRDLFITYKEFDPSKVTYGKVKVDSRGGKNVPILYDGKPLRIQTPLILNWGVNENVDEQSGSKKYNVALQFQREGNGPVVKFFEKMNEFQSKILSDCVSNCKSWFGKTKMSEDIASALFWPLLKYPKDKETQEPDESRNPTMKVKIPYWDGKYNIELYDMDRNLICDRPAEEDVDISDLIPKASHFCGIIECSGIWFAAGRFSVPFKMVLGKVRPPARLKGCCLVEDSEEEGELEQIESREQEESRREEEKDSSTNVEVVDSEEEEAVEEAEPEPAPKKKKVVRKKKKAAE
jgi:hypothetical protein